MENFLEQTYEATYEGDLNANGEREGFGKMTWEDGSFYEGDW